MRLIAATVLLSSFLVFQVQPLIGKYILPWFGGTPAVWTACLLFFQSALLIGYAYTHFVVDRFSVRKQVLIHSTILALTLLCLPVTPLESLKPEDASWPLLRVLLVLVTSVGLPFVLVSSTAPLMQSWFSHVYPGRSPYRLYALSNVGSLLGLFAYPFLVERMLRLSSQTIAWSIGYLVFVTVCLGVGWWVRRQLADGGVPASPDPPRSETVAAKTDASPDDRIRGIDIFLWLALSACGSVVLLATTNQLCQNVAAVPFLWVVPLGLYLVTFILCFDSDGWYRRGIFTVAWLFALGLGLWSALGANFSLPAHIVVYSIVVFVCCMVCHGELAKLKPQPHRLTLYFFLVAVGGALGGLFVSLVAPLIFDRYHEFYIGLFGSGLAMLMVLRRELWITLEGAALQKSVRATAAFVGALVLLIVGASFANRMANQAEGAATLAMDRNFYGTVSVQRVVASDPRYSVNTFTHGNTTHGLQYVSPEQLQKPTGYYQRGSGVGLAIEQHTQRLAGEPLRIGLIGLGVGTLAAYAEADDELEFYEIDPNVERFARDYFTFLGDAGDRGAAIEVRLGDARILLERQLENEGSRQFDILVLDAFSSDAVPVHLLTTEAFALYRQHLAADGIIAVHLSNRHLDLAPVVRSAADVIEMDAFQIWHQTPGEETMPDFLRLHSHWVLLTNDQNFRTRGAVAKAVTPWESEMAEIVWTDQVSSLFQVLKKDG